METNATKNWRVMWRGLGTYIASNQGGRPPSWPAFFIAAGCGILASKLTQKRTLGPD